MTTISARIGLTFALVALSSPALSATPEDVAPLIVKMLSPDYDKNGALVNYRETIKT